MMCTKYKGLKIKERKESEKEKRNNLQMQESQCLYLFIIFVKYFLREKINRKGKKKR